MAKKLAQPALGKQPLTVDLLQREAGSFAEVESIYAEPSLYGVTDGKAVGTYFEHKFQAYLQTRYEYERGSSASGIDFPGLAVDIQTTTGLRKILENDGNEDDLIAFMHERYLPVDPIEASQIAQELLKRPPEVGYLTISNALQWRLQYRRVIEKAGSIDGIIRIR